MKRFLAGAAVLASLSAPCLAQTTARQAQPGFNLFTVNQDVEIGRQSAIEAEKQLTLLNDPSVDRYLNRIIQRLAAVAPGAQYPYHIKAVNASEINAFALPGGPLYVNRGTIQAARSEAELAGVLAHEMSHVALRHGTHQASRAYLAQSGLGILGGLFGRQSSAASIVNTVGGVGLNALFLKYSRDDEYAADATGARIMAKAGYDPAAMANFFELLRAEQSRNPSKVEQFFSDHPPPADREARIRQLASSLGTGRSEVLGGFTTIRADLSRLSATGTQQIVEQVPNPLIPDTATVGAGPVQVARPSSRLVRFAQPNGFFSINYPANWRAYPSGLAVTLAPDGGVLTRSDGRQVLLYGIIVNHYFPFTTEDTRRNLSLQRNYAPFEDRTLPRGRLEDATDDLIRTVLSANPYLHTDDEAAQPEVVSGAQGFSMVLSGTSPVTGEEERVTVYTRGLSDGHVVYMLWVVPGRDYATMDRTFARMLRTLNVNDTAVHQTAGMTSRYGPLP
jgi:Zn-dependent protease with chaperone function